MMARVSCPVLHGHEPVTFDSHYGMMTKMTHWNFVDYFLLVQLVSNMIGTGVGTGRGIGCLAVVVVAVVEIFLLDGWMMMRLMLLLSILLMHSASNHDDDDSCG